MPDRGRALPFATFIQRSVQAWRGSALHQVNWPRRKLVVCLSLVPTDNDGSARDCGTPGIRLEQIGLASPVVARSVMTGA